MAKTEETETAEVGARSQMERHEAFVEWFNTEYGEDLNTCDAASIIAKFAAKRNEFRRSKFYLDQWGPAARAKRDAAAAKEAAAKKAEREKAKKAADAEKAKAAKEAAAAKKAAAKAAPKTAPAKTTASKPKASTKKAASKPTSKRAPRKAAPPKPAAASEDDVFA